MAETRMNLGPFEPDLVRTSVGKWSLRIQGLKRFLRIGPIWKPLQFSGRLFDVVPGIVSYGTSCSPFCWRWGK